MYTVVYIFYFPRLLIKEFFFWKFQSSHCYHNSHFFVVFYLFWPNFIFSVYLHLMKKIMIKLKIFLLLRLWISKSDFRPETDKVWLKFFLLVHLLPKPHETKFYFYDKKTKFDDFIIEKQPYWSKWLKKVKFLK